MVQYSTKNFNIGRWGWAFYKECVLTVCKMFSDVFFDLQFHTIILISQRFREVKQLFHIIHLMAVAEVPSHPRAHFRDNLLEIPVFSVCFMKYLIQS